MPASSCSGNFLSSSGCSLEVAARLVGDHSHRLATERTADGRAVFHGLQQRVLVTRCRARLRRRDEPGADPDTICAERERGRKSATVEDPTRGDDGHTTLDCVDDLRHERHRRDLTGVATGFGALRDNDVAAGFDRGDRVADLPAHREHEHRVLMTERDHVARHTQSGGEHARALADEQFDVVHQPVGKCGEKVDTQWLRRERLGGADLLAELFGGHRRSAEAAEAARFGDGRDESAVGHASHPGEHHRVLDAEHFRQACLHGS